MRLVQGRWLRVVVVALLVTVLGCTDDGDTPDPGGTAGSETPGAETGTDAAVESAVDVVARLRLERALGHDTVLVINALRHITDDSPRTAMVRRALRRTGKQLSRAAAAVLDIDPADFGAVWDARTAALLELADDDDRDDLEAAQDEYGALVARALGDRLPADEATEQLRRLDDQLVEQLAAYRDGELEDAYAAQREAFGAAVRLGQDLVVAARPAPAVTAGAVELRSALQQLFAEHAALAVMTTRHAGRGSQQTAAAGSALNGNSEDLAAALLSIYGEQEAVRFDAAWRDAIAAAVDRAVAAAELDDDAGRQARRRQRKAVAASAEAVAAMTQDTITQRQARRRFTAYFQLLGRYGAAVANGRWRPAARLAPQVYDAGSGLGVLLGTRIAEHRPDEFPRS